MVQIFSAHKLIKNSNSVYVFVFVDKVFCPQTFLYHVYLQKRFWIIFFSRNVFVQFRPETFFFRYINVFRKEFLSEIIFSSRNVSKKKHFGKTNCFQNLRKFFASRTGLFFVQAGFVQRIFLSRNVFDTTFFLFSGEKIYITFEKTST